MANKVPMKVPYVVGVLNEKGGSWKSTTVCTLASTLSCLGFKVLMIDCDPSGNLSHTLLRNADPKYVLYDVLMAPVNFPLDLNLVVRHTNFGDLIPTERTYNPGERPIPQPNQEPHDLESIEPENLEDFKDKSLSTFFYQEVQNDLQRGLQRPDMLFYNLIHRSAYREFMSQYDFVVMDSGKEQPIIDNVVNACGGCPGGSIIIPIPMNPMGAYGATLTMDRAELVSKEFGEKWGKNLAPIVDGFLRGLPYKDINAVATQASIAEAKAVLEEKYNAYKIGSVYETVIRNSSSAGAQLNTSALRPAALGCPTGSANLTSSDNGQVDAFNFTLEFLRRHNIPVRKMVDGIIEDERGHLMYVRNGTKIYTYLLDRSGVAHIQPFPFRSEYLDSPEWKAALGSRVFISEDRLRASLVAAGVEAAPAPLRRITGLDTSKIIDSIQKKFRALLDEDGFLISSDSDASADT